jgi:hypothetical protein
MTWARFGAVNHVAVSRDPTHIRGAPVDVLVVQVEHGPRGRGDLCQVAARGVHHALRLPGRARGIEDEERVLGILVFGRAVRERGRRQLVVPMVPAGPERGVHLLAQLTAPADDHDVLDRG